MNANQKKAVAKIWMANVIRNQALMDISDADMSEDDKEFIRDYIIEFSEKLSSVNASEINDIVDFVKN